jgi:hypothetical protein
LGEDFGMLPADGVRMSRRVVGSRAGRGGERRGGAGKGFKQSDEGCAYVHLRWDVEAGRHLCIGRQTHLLLLRHHVRLQNYRANAGCTYLTMATRTQPVEQSQASE